MGTSVHFERLDCSNPTGEPKGWEIARYDGSNRRDGVSGGGGRRKQSQDGPSTLPGCGQGAVFDLLECFKTYHEWLKADRKDPEFCPMPQ